MIQDQNKRAWPSAGGSVTLTFIPMSRQAEGAGAFSTGTPMPGNLVIVFPSGRDDQVTLSALREALITHFLNSNAFVAWWAPETQTLEASLRDALSAFVPGSFTASTTVYVFFDGQFGSVRVS